MGLTELLNRWTAYFWSLPLWPRTTILIFAGLVLTLGATRRFQEETVMALVYIAIAVLLFWTGSHGFRLSAQRLFDSRVNP
jgi:divalent metal cation (Fe/Co/Zn/Cd) transporter